MKKILVIALVLGLAFFAASANAQEKYVGGGFEMAGSIVTGMGYQYHNDKANTENATGVDGVITGPGPMGKYMGINPDKKNYFGFFLDGVELDIMKSFGENVRLRADLDFGRVNSAGQNTQAFILEQAYATANIPVGNGIEFLVGRFNAPIGFEAVDVADNDLISQSILIRGQIRPVDLTGAKFYYAFSDLVDFHLWVANRIIDDDNLGRRANMPAIGARIGFNWGEEGTESTFGISPFVGPSSLVSNRHYSFGVDADLNWWLTESFALGLEGIYRRDNATPWVAGAENMNTFAGLLNLHYVFSDVWDGTLRYSMAMQRDDGTNGVIDYIGGSLIPVVGSLKQQVHEIALGGGYAVADGAKFKLEGRFDIVKPTSGAGETQYVFGAVMGFVYNF